MNADDEFAQALRLHQAGRLAEAAAGYRRALAIDPRHALALCNLSGALIDLGQTDEAMSFCLRALDVDPNMHEAHSNHANILNTLGRPAEALAAAKKALALCSNDPNIFTNLGNCLNNLGRFNEALAAYKQALNLYPNYVEAISNIGSVLARMGHRDEAIAAFRHCLKIRPTHAAAASNLGAALNELGRPDEALAACKHALALQPNSAHAHNNLGNAFKDAARLDEAIACYRAAVRLNPTDAAVHSNVIYTLQFHPAYDEAALYAEQRQWNQIHALPLQSRIRPHKNDRSPHRRLKVGYVSPYFFSHAETFFTLPLLECHDHTQFEIHCYASLFHTDEFTQRTRAAADRWHDVLPLSDEDLAEKIRADEIDILIDLSMHMSQNRLRVFAQKPAPVQIAWLAYPGGTGLDAMDHRITDPFLDPPDKPTDHYREQSIRLKDCWCCYDPLGNVPMAAARNGNSIRFGSLNNSCKISEPLLKLWARVLVAVPDSSILMQALSQDHQARIRAIFQSVGFSPSRIDFTGRIPRPDYLRLHDQIDICLDPLPYNGITTTCDALWMGVPVVTLQGKTAAGCAGAGILSAVGLPDLIANTEDQFVEIATKLATDQTRLAGLRTSLRQKMIESPLMDAGSFTRKMEAAYRETWITWCTKLPS
jgi:protein O-GlcNAc transferase